MGSPCRHPCSVHSCQGLRSSFPETSQSSSENHPRCIWSDVSPRCFLQIILITLRDGPRCSEMIPDDARWTQLIPDESRWSQMIPDHPRCPQMIPEDPWFSEMIQTIPDNPEWFLMVYEFRDGPMWFQMIINDPRCSQIDVCSLNRLRGIFYWNLKNQEQFPRDFASRWLSDVSVCRREGDQSNASDTIPQGNCITLVVGCVLMPETIKETRETQFPWGNGVRLVVWCVCMPKAIKETRVMQFPRGNCITPVVWCVCLP